jgi:hypothetical protein
MSDADDILARMQHVRRDVGDDVHQVVQNAKRLTDWRHHVRKHPWACVGAAFAAGFLAFPKPRRIANEETKELIALLKRHNIALPADSASSRHGMMGALLSTAMPVAVRLGMSLVNQRLNAGPTPGRAQAPPSTFNQP